MLIEVLAFTAVVTIPMPSAENTASSISSTAGYNSSGSGAFVQRSRSNATNRQGNRNSRRGSRADNQFGRQVERLDRNENRSENQSDRYDNRRDVRQDTRSDWNSYYRRHPAGHRVAKLPTGHSRVLVGSRRYYYSSGVYYNYVRGSYVVVAAPVGARLRTLPQGYRAVNWNGNRYYYVNNTYYVLANSGREYVVITKPKGIIVAN